MSKSNDLTQKGVSDLIRALTYLFSEIRAGHIAGIPASVEQQNNELRRFVKLVADRSNDPLLVLNAQELLVLYGDPDAQQPRGIITP